MTEGRELKITLVTDTTKAQKNLNTFEGKLKGLASSVKLAAAGLAAGAAYFALDAAVDGIKNASDLQETISKTGQIFGDQAGKIEAFANTANTSLGQTKQQAMDAASTFATFGKAAGLAGNDLTGFSTQLTTLSADLASFYNTSPEQAITAISAALRGEAEPIRQYGVLLDDASLKAEYFAKTGEKVTGTLTPQQKVLAAQALILKQTSDAQGDFARTAGGMANGARILSATIDDLKTSFGTGFLSGISKADGSLSDLGKTLQDLKPLFEQVGTAAGNATSDILNGLKPVAGAVTEVTKSYEDQNFAAKTWSMTSHILTTDIGTLIQEVVGLKKMTDLETKSTEDSFATHRLLEKGYRDSAAAARDLAQAALTAAAAQAGVATSTYFGGTPTSGYTESYAANARALAMAAIKARSEAEKLNTSIRGGGSAASSANPALERYQAGLKKLAADTQAAATAAKTAQDNFANFAGEVSTAISAGLNLGDAVQKQFDQVAKIADLDAKIAEAIKKGDEEGKAKAEADKAALGAATSWVDTFVAQIGQRNAAADAINRLKAQLVTEAGKPIAGADLLVAQILTGSPQQIVTAVDDLINRGIAPQLITQLQNSQALTDAAANGLATPFYGAGVTSTDNVLNGLIAQAQKQKPAFKKVGGDIGKDIADGIREQIAQVLADARAAKSGLRMNPAAGMLTSAPSHVINISAPLGDPVAIARRVEQILGTAARRTGGAW